MLADQPEAKKPESFWQPLTGLFRVQKKEFISLEKEFIFVDFNAWEYAVPVHNLYLSI